MILSRRFGATFSLIACLAVAAGNGHSHGATVTEVNANLATKEKAHGPEHPDVASALSDLADANENDCGYGESVADVRGRCEFEL